MAAGAPDPLHYDLAGAGPSADAESPQGSVFPALPPTPHRTRARPLAQGRPNPEGFFVHAPIYINGTTPRLAGDGYGDVYLIWSLETLKGYVGVTTGAIESRAKRHIQKRDGRPLCVDMRALGADAFSLYVLDQPHISSLKAAERTWIDVLGTFRPYGYNLTRGGGM